MGFFSKVKNKAKNALGNAAPPTPTTSPAESDLQPEAAAPMAVDADGSGPHEQTAAGPSFTWDGDIYALPTGWDDLSMEDWFYKFEMLRDRMMHIDDETGLQPMVDEDGDALDPEEVLLITAFGFKTGREYEAYRNWSVCKWAQQTGESPTDCEFRMGGIARERIMAEKAKAMSGAGGALSPVEGIALEAWAQIQAQVASGVDHLPLIAAAGMDTPKWDRVSAEWNARMSSDTTGTVATAYGNAFAGGGVGQFGGAAAQAASQGIGGDVGAEPVPFETFVEVGVAQSAASDRGEDVHAVLASFGMTAVDWSNIGMYWNKRMAQEATTYHRLYSEYSEKYAAKYGH